MSDLTVDGTSSWGSGTEDTRTVMSNGPTGTEGRAENINGLSKFVLDLQAVLGTAASLVGTASSLGARLSTIFAGDGSLNKGSSFPVSPPPINGQLFYRTDLKIVYLYDSGTGQWVEPFTSSIYALLDGSRNFTGSLTMKASTPAVRFIGQEVNALDWELKENGGALRTYLNSGTESSPSWTEDNFFCPTGVYIPFGGVSSPNGWLLCDGGAYSRSTYSRLFTVVGTAYGAGDGSTTFNVPDLRGRTPIMIDGATGRITSASVNGANATTIGGTGGAQTHTLLLSESPTHAHQETAGAGVPMKIADGLVVGSVPVISYTNANTSNTNVPLNTLSVGGGSSHSNTQPWLAGNFIIKT